MARDLFIGINDALLDLNTETYRGITAAAKEVAENVCLCTVSITSKSFICK